MISGLEIAASARAAIRPRIVRPALVFNTRALHASPSTFKKKENVTSNEVEEDDDFANADEDLFDTVDTLPPPTQSSSSSSSTNTPRKPINPRTQLERHALISQLRDAVDLPPTKRREAIKPFKTRIIREIITRYEGEDVGELKSVLRTWRFLGRRLTRRAAGEALAKSHKGGKVGLAVEVLNDPVQYGMVEVTNTILLRLHMDILVSNSITADAPAESPSTPLPLPRLPNQSITPTIALANLTITSRAKPESDPRALVQAMDISLSDEFETLESWEKRRADWITELDTAGEGWGNAGRDIAGRLGPLVANKVVKTKVELAAENEKRREERQSNKLRRSAGKSPTPDAVVAGDSPVSV